MWVFVNFFLIIFLILVLFLLWHFYKGVRKKDKALCPFVKTTDSKLSKIGKYLFWLVYLSVPLYFVIGGLFYAVSVYADYHWSYCLTQEGFTYDGSYGDLSGIECINTPSTFSILLFFGSIILILIYAELLMFQKKWYVYLLYLITTIPLVVYVMQRIPEILQP